MSAPERAVVAGLPDPGRCQVLGVVNVTPDSFSDGGRWLDARDAIEHGVALAADGADIVDVGGESTRPGAPRIDADEEERRVLPVVAGLVEREVVVSVDTTRARVAARAVEAGAAVINDVSGGRADPDMLRLVADAEVPFVLMHWREHSAAMQRTDHTTYADLVTDVVAELSAQVDAALAAGIHPDRLVVDPGLGFSKNGAQNWTLLAQLDAVSALGFAVLVGGSRKRFLGELLAVTPGDLRPVTERQAATVALTALAAAAGAWGVRVHDVRANADAVLVAQRWSRG